MRTHDGVGPQLFGDKGYISQSLAKSLRQMFDLQLITKLRANMKNQLMPLADRLLLRKRASLRLLLISSRTSLRLSILAIAVFQRLTTSFHLPPLDLTPFFAYIRYNIQFSCYKGGSLFSDDALTRIYEYTKESPDRLTASAPPPASLV